MKAAVFKNLMNSDRFICDDPRLIKSIDGVDYLLVHRIDNDRKFLMRKDALIQDKAAMVKWRSQNPAKV